MEENRDQIVILYALHKLKKHIYADTVDPSLVAKRRARNKVARVSRRINRTTR